MANKLKPREETGNETRRGGYDYLATGIIEQAILDYCHSIRRLSVLKNQLKDAEEGKMEVRELRPDEPKARWYNDRARHRPNFFKRKIWIEEEELDSCLKFFKSEWFETISTLDGQIILDQCNKVLREEGHTIPDPTVKKVKLDENFDYKAIVVYDLLGVHLNTYESVKEASTTLGIASQNISKVLNGGAGSHKGYVFKYNIQEKRY